MALSRMQDEYTNAELRLFGKFGMLRLTHTLIPTTAYKLAVHKAFVKDMKGPAVDALRRAVIHMDGGGFRKNPEFDKLIDFLD